MGTSLSEVPFPDPSRQVTQGSLNDGSGVSQKVDAGARDFTAEPLLNVEVPKEQQQHHLDQLRSSKS
eukprot:CAMPEP_0167776572 /NCGR_PEP_ID=MMETSP0111_2-20121227/3202_1 /TAXON_ID=91324 /ORGANISM="Lotharella globosa, Strain CCCM811" /LENGTH=66 /DNA_ID=CAMNT_0007666639 /DNA_START=53 /DNA_END=253 /DNA_ORIENTATION=+